MIIVDTNVFLRFLTTPVTPEDQQMAEAARGLFEAVERGDETITTTDVVLHEVTYLLVGRGHYAHTVEAVATAFREILNFPGFWLPQESRRRYLDALDLWERFPTLGFADALLAVIALETESELASFDRDFDRVPGLRRWTPSHR